MLLKRISEISLIFFPFFLVIGPIFYESAILVIVINYLLGFKEKENIKKINILYIRYFGLLILILIVSSIFSNFFLVSIWKSLTYIRFILFPLAIAFLLRNNQNLLISFFKSIAIIYIFLIFDGFLQLLTGANSLHYLGKLSSLEHDPSNFLHVGNKIQSVFRDEGIYGSFLIRLLPLLLSLIFLFNLKKKNYLILILLVSLFILIFFSGERSAFLLFIILFLFLFIIKKLRKVLFYSFLLLLLISSILFKNFPVNKHRMVDVPLGILMKKDIHDFDNHKNLFLLSIKIFKKNPLLGSGPKTFGLASKEINFIYQKEGKEFIVYNIHPHNFYLQALAELGISGFLFIFFLFIFIILKIINIYSNIQLKKKENHKAFYLFVFIGFFINLFPFITNGSLFNNWLSSIMYLFIGFLFFISEKKNYKL
jgi:O-antigen ligase